MTKRLFVRSFATLFALFFLAGCSPEFTDDVCSSDDDCFIGETCVENQCIPGSNPNNLNNTNNENNLNNSNNMMDMGNNNNDMAVTVSSVIVTPPESTLDLTETVTLAARPVSSNGTDLDRPVTWSTSDPNIATVDAVGQVTGVAEGTVTITATSDGVDGTATVTVEKRPVATVVLSPDMTTLGLGNSVQLTVTVSEAGGDALFGRNIVFTSSDTNVATVISDGTVTAEAVGTATITATVEGVMGTSAITVDPDPVATVVVTPDTAQVEVAATIQLAGQTFDSNNQELIGRAVTWSSSDDNLATVDTMGRVTGVAVGTVTITGSSEGQMDTATVTIIPRPVTSVVVTPSSADVVAGSTEQLSAETRASDGTDLMRATTWMSSNTAVATVDANGLVTAVAPGSATITATSEGVMGTANINVIPQVAMVVVGPTNPSLDPTDTQQMTATPQDSGGNDLVNRDAATWMSSNTAVATVSMTGVVTAVAPGTATITATIEGVSGNTTVTVREPVASVVVTPANPTIVVGNATALMATPRDSGNNDLTGRDAATWMSSNTGVAIVNSSGVVTAVGPGTSTITATIEGVSGNTTVNVLAAIATVEVTGSAAGADVGGMVTFTATPKDSGGNDLTGRTCTFSSGNTSVATINSTSGVATVAGEGDTTITATCEGTQGTAPIAGYGAVATVTINEQGISIAATATQQYTVTLQDSSGHTLTGRTVTWMSDNMAAATVNASGLATGVAAGTATITATSETINGTTTLTVTP